MKIKTLEMKRSQFVKHKQKLRTSELIVNGYITIVSPSFNTKRKLQHFKDKLKQN